MSCVLAEFDACCLFEKSQASTERQLVREMHRNKVIKFNRTVFSALGVLFIVSVAALPAAARSEIVFKTPYAAMQQGVAAYRSGNFQIAIAAFEYAVKHNVFPARYYLARIYANNSSNVTDHVKAFRLLHEFVQTYADTDPADYRKAPTVARAMTRLARYIRDGLPEIGLQADVVRAVEYFYHSATFFNDGDAQFELARLQLVGDGVRRSEHSALHWLSVLSRKGHPGAQAFLADLNWRGKHTKRNPIRALILIALAIENAPQEDRIWIEDIYQNIFCGASEDTKNKVSRMVVRWRTKFGRAVRQERLDILSSLNFGPQRTCADGRPVHRLVPSEEVIVPRLDNKGITIIGGTNDRVKFETVDGDYRNTGESKATER